MPRNCFLWSEERSEIRWFQGELTFFSHHCLKIAVPNRSLFAMWIFTEWNKQAMQAEDEKTSEALTLRPHSPRTVTRKLERDRLTGARRWNALWGHRKQKGHTERGALIKAWGREGQNEHKRSRGPLLREQKRRASVLNLIW